MMDFDSMDAITEEGWCEWIHPLPGYLMKCCDCGLVHELDARVGRVVERDANGTFTWDDDETKDVVVMMRMKRRDDLGA